MKIKKDNRPQLEKLPAMKIKYNLVVPMIGLVDFLTMVSFMVNPANRGNLFLTVFFGFFAIVGAIFAYWGLMWKITADGKNIKVHPAFGSARSIPFADLKKAVVHKKDKSNSLVFYELIDVRGKQLVKIYPLMKQSGAFLERLKRLNIPIEEEHDR